MSSESGWSALSDDDSDMLGVVVDTTGSVIVALRPDHRIFAWNRAAEALYQTPRAQAIGTNYVETFIAPEHRAAVAADIELVLAGKRTLNFEDDSVLPDGTRRTLLWNVCRVLDASGAPAGIVATGQDITERKEAEERFRLIFEHSLDGLLLSDDTGVVDCNPAALRMLGLTDKAQLIGHRPAEFSPPLQPDGTPSDLKSRQLGALTLQEGAQTFDWVHARPDGTPVPVEVSVRHTVLSGRRVSVVAWRDQSRRAELERDRREVEQRLNQAHKMEVVGQLAGGVAHDFNNLLAAIRNSIQLAVNEVPRDVPIRNDLELALHTTERAARLTGQLLAFSRPDRGTTAQVDVAAVVRDLVPLLRTSLPTDVTVAVDADVPGAHVVMDRNQLEQALLNIAFNARDAMPSGGTLRVQVAHDAPAQAVVVTIADTGAGMDSAIVPRVFEPFFTTKPVGSGTGLGLAVVYGVVTQAGGTVRAESARGAGTRIVITLPRADGVVPPATVPAAADVPRVTILLVDDDDAVRSTTRRLLEKQQFRVVDVPTGVEALSRFTAERDGLSLLLTDVRMPGMDGVKLARAIRAVDPHFPVVFFSGYDEMAADVFEALPGALLLTKPFSLHGLLTVLHDAMARRAATG